MADKGDKTELDRAVEQHREATGPEQPALLPELVDGASVPAVKSKGRPSGSRNLRSEAYAALLIRDAGADPLLVATRIAATNVLDADKVAELARTWGCDRFEAVKLWAKINADVQPYLHQQLPRALHINPGAPGSGERVLLEIDGEFHDVTPGDDDDENEAA